MSVCPNCNYEASGTEKFCPNCGKELFENIFCPQCGSLTTSEFAFCQKCGASIKEEDVAVNEPEIASESAAQPTQEDAAQAADTCENLFEAEKISGQNKKGFFSKKKLIAAVALILVVAVALSASLIYFSAQKRRNFVLYYKNGNTYLGGGFEKVKLSESTLSAWNGTVPVYSEDYKKLFFADEITSNGFTLRYLNMSNPEEDQRISKNVSSYQISSNGKKVVFIKNGDLYLSNLKEDDKLKSDVTSYSISQNGKRIVYLTDSGKLYIAKNADDETKIASSVESFVVGSKNNYSDVYYIKKGNLYLFDGKDSEKIAEDVNEVLATYKSGELYYTKNSSQEMTLMDYINDDMAQEDEDFEMPERPNRPYSFEYDTDKEYEAAYAQYETLIEEYNDARDFYYEKENRDELREELEDEVIENESSTLYFYNGSKSVEVTDSFAYATQINSDDPMMIFYAYNQSEIDEINISEISDIYDVSSMIDAALYSSEQTYVALEDTTRIIDGDSAQFNEDGDTVYYISDDDLYKAEISGKKLKKESCYKKDVDAFYVLGKDTVVTEKYEESDDEYEYSSLSTVSINKKKVAESVSAVLWSDDYKTFYLIEDYDPEKECGKLIRYKNGKTKTIDKGVCDFTITPNGKLYYIADYDAKENKGDLFVYKMGKGKEIEHNVSGFGYAVSYEFYRNILSPSGYYPNEMDDYVIED